MLRDSAFMAHMGEVESALSVSEDLSAAQKYIMVDQSSSTWTKDLCEMPVITASLST